MNTLNTNNFHNFSWFSKKNLCFFGPYWPLVISYPFRSSLEAREKPSNIQQLRKQKCVICRKIQNNGILEKFRICEPARASKTLKAAIYLQDDVFTKIANLEIKSRVFHADLYRNCI